MKSKTSSTANSTKNRLHGGKIPRPPVALQVLGSGIERLKLTPPIFLRFSEEERKGHSGRLQGGLQVRLNSVAAAAELILFAGRFLDAQPANAAAGAAGNFQLGTYEPFARRSFRFPLRGRDCSSAAGHCIPHTSVAAKGIFRSWRVPERKSERPPTRASWPRVFSYAAPHSALH